MKNKNKAEEILGFIELTISRLKDTLSNTNPAAIAEVTHLENKIEQLNNLIQLED